MYKRLERPTIKGNKYGGTMYLLLDTVDPVVVTDVIQVEEWQETEHHIEKRVRKGQLMGDINDMVAMQFEPDEKIPGKVVVKESFDPPVEDDPEAFIKKIKGKICRIDNKVVYRIEYYTQDPVEQDVIIS